VSRYALELAGFEERSTWGWDPPSESYVAQLYRNGTSPNRDVDDPDLWFSGIVRIHTPEALASAIADAVDVGIVEVLAAMYAWPCDVFGFDPGHLGHCRRCDRPPAEHPSSPAWRRESIRADTATGVGAFGVRTWDERRGAIRRAGALRVITLAGLGASLGAMMWGRRRRALALAGIAVVADMARRSRGRQERTAAGPMGLAGQPDRLAIDMATTTVAGRCGGCSAGCAGVDDDGSATNGSS
jgi:hypothetical protein